MELGLGDVIVFYNTADKRKYYGWIMERGMPHTTAKAKNKTRAEQGEQQRLYCPEQWVRVVWLGAKKPFGNESDVLNKTSRLISRYDMNLVGTSKVHTSKERVL